MKIFFLLFISKFIYCLNLPLFFDNIYKKKITHKTFINNILIPYNRQIENLKHDFNFIKTKYSKKNIIINEINYLLNKNIKVYIHLEQLISNTNIYHIGVTYTSIFYSIRYDIGTFDEFNINIFKNNRKTKKIFWDYSNKTIKQIHDYEKDLEYKYILGIYDCRHYVRNLTTWSCSKNTPVWRLYKYF